MGDLVSDTTSGDTTGDTLPDDSFSSALEQPLTEEELKLSDADNADKSSDVEQNTATVREISTADGDDDIPLTQSTQQPFDADTPRINSPASVNRADELGIELVKENTENSSSLELNKDNVLKEAAGENDNAKCSLTEKQTVCG